MLDLHGVLRRSMWYVLEPGLVIGLDPAPEAFYNHNDIFDSWIRTPCSLNANK